MKTSTKYELKFKQRGHGWRTFDSYTDKSDPAIKEFSQGLKSKKFVESVKLVTVTTVREDEFL